jgi:hypothetical protein
MNKSSVYLNNSLSDFYYNHNLEKKRKYDSVIDNNTISEKSILESKLECSDSNLNFVSNFYCDNNLDKKIKCDKDINIDTNKNSQLESKSELNEIVLKSNLDNTKELKVEKIYDFIKIIFNEIENSYIIENNKYKFPIFIKFYELISEEKYKEEINMYHNYIRELYFNIIFFPLERRIIRYILIKNIYLKTDKSRLFYIVKKYYHSMYSILEISD